MTDTTAPNRTPSKWHMFCEYGPGLIGSREVIARPGDDFLTAQMDDLARRVRADEMKARDLYGEIAAIQKRTVAAGFGEVHDTEPEWAICDFVNVLCDEQGWAHVSRWEFY